MSAVDSAGVRFGPFELRPSQRQLLVDGQPAALGARAIDVLCVLVEHRHRLVSRDELLDRVWAGLVVEENNLAVQISALRKVLGPLVIATIPGRGYRFTPGREPDRPDRPDAVTPPAAGLAVPAPIGRDDELRALQALVATHPVVTVVGPGGIGKTTLVRALAATLQARWSDGTCTVALAAVTGPQGVARAIAQALQMPLPHAADETACVVAALASQRLLLVLDNCEHLLGAVAAVAAAIRAGAPGVRLLATSQVLLNVDGEALLRLGPLAVPPPGADADDDPAVSGAIALFVDRARRADRSFALVPANAASVAEVCRRLDGLPLAIELAAARVRLLGVQGVVRRLDDRFMLLTGGPRTAPARHQTLLATMQWSHALLSPGEQRLLRRLGVFAGSFALEMVAPVAAAAGDDDDGAGWAVLDALSGLIDKSFVAADRGDPPRYRLLESTRAFALERLAEAGETAVTRRRHAEAVRAWFMGAHDDLFADDGSGDMQACVERIEPDIHNWRLALDWAADEPGGLALAAALLGSAAMFLKQLSLSPDAVAAVAKLYPRLDELHALADPAVVASCLLAIFEIGYPEVLPAEDMLATAARAIELLRPLQRRTRLFRALYDLAWMLASMGRLDAAEHAAREMERQGRSTDPLWLRALGVNLRAANLMARERFADAIELLSALRAELLHRQGHDSTRARCENNLCAALNCLGRFDEVTALVASIPTPEGSFTHAYAMFQLLHAQTFCGALPDAMATLRAAMPGWQRHQMLLFGAPHLAALLAGLGRHADAARLDGAVRAHLRRSGVVLPPVRRIARANVADRLRAAAIADDTVEQWRLEGEALDERAVARIFTAC